MSFAYAISPYHHPMPNVITQAFAIGVVAGMRSMTAPALVTHYLSGGRRPRLGRLNFMRSKAAATAFKVAAAGELVGDKLPNTPARTQAGPLVGRALSGVLCGAALARGGRESAVAGAVFGAVGGIVGTYAFHALRRTLTEAGLPDLVVALGEDALAVGGGRAILEM